MKKTSVSQQKFFSFDNLLKCERFFEKLFTFFGEYVIIDTIYYYVFFRDTANDIVLEAFCEKRKCKKVY